MRGGGTSKARGIKKSKVAPATKGEVLARLSIVMTNNMDTSVGSLTRLMVKTYNDAKAAEGSGKTIEFTDFGDYACNNMMLVHKPLHRCAGKAPRKQFPSQVIEDEGDVGDAYDGPNFTYAR